ncbi:MAG: lysozyme [Rhodoblastus sp.]
MIDAPKKGRLHGLVVKNKALLAGTSVAAAISIATATIQFHEGTKYKVYRDPVGILTFCTGETRNPQPGHTYTPAECDALLEKRLLEFNAGLDRCQRQPIPTGIRAAWLDTIYNIGVGAFCNSSMARLFNEGRLRESCDALKKFVYARRVWLAGLFARREDMIEFCYAGILK